MKYLILDVDGTLTNSKKEITPATKEAILDIEKLGHKIIIATGRPTKGVKWIIEELQMKKYGGYTLCFNGARVTDLAADKIVYQNIFPAVNIPPMFEYAKKHDMGMVTYEGDTVIYGTKLDDYMSFEARLNFMDMKYIENFTDYVDFDVNKCLFTAEPDRAPALEKEMVELFGKNLSIYRSEDFFIEAMPLGVDKAASLDRLFDVIKVSKEDTIACGDGFNDKSMIEYAGIGVCMQNGKDPVKEAADYITEKSNDEDGIVEVIEKFIL